MSTYFFKFLPIMFLIIFKPNKSLYYCNTGDIVFTNMNRTICCIVANGNNISIIIVDSLYK